MTRRMSGVDGHDDQRSRVDSAVVTPRVEVGEKSLIERVPGKRVDVRGRLDVVERNLPPLHVHVDAHSLRPPDQRHADRSAAEGPVALVLPHPQGPVARLRVEYVPSFPVDGLKPDSDVPLRLSLHLDLVVQPPRGETLLPQNADTGVKSLGVVREAQRHVAVKHVLLVFRQHQFGMSRLRVQSHANGTLPSPLKFGLAQPLHLGLHRLLQLTRYSPDRPPDRAHVHGALYAESWKAVDEKEVVFGERQLLQLGVAPPQLVDLLLQLPDQPSGLAFDLPLLGTDHLHHLGLTSLDQVEQVVEDLHALFDLPLRVPSAELNRLIDVDDFLKSDVNHFFHLRGDPSDLSSPVAALVLHRHGVMGAVVSLDADLAHKEAEQSRQDLRALTPFPTHTSHDTSPLPGEHGSAVLASTCSFLSSEFLNCKATSDMKVLTLSSGFRENFCLHMGHWDRLALCQYPCMQSLQKLCPQGVVTGWLNRSRQMGHRSCSSVSTPPADAISGENTRKEKAGGVLKKRFSLNVVALLPVDSCVDEAEWGFTLGAAVQLRLHD
ncbi:hypothetical protein EYF80_030486 [Liparis tanakae]|uniref:Uncharacterized protein n=1 Tax=Liparis tanakae TaxID=230148 RepID=A0A4Z2H0K9_9TELE|nr:hypothetical protein EYF80_030486 [Liparis tanakae]